MKGWWKVETNVNKVSYSHVVVTEAPFVQESSGSDVQLYRLLCNAGRGRHVGAEFSPADGPPPCATCTEMLKSMKHPNTKRLDGVPKDYL